MTGINPIIYAEKIAELVNHGDWRRATKQRIWQGAYGDGVATADRYGGVSVAERIGAHAIPAYVRLQPQLCIVNLRFSKSTVA